MKAPSTVGRRALGFVGSLLVALASTKSTQGWDGWWLADRSESTSIDEMLWQLAQQPDVGVFDEHLKATEYAEMAPPDRPSSAPRSRPQQRAEARRLEDLKQHTLDARIQSLRNQGDSASTAELAELASLIYMRNGRREGSDTARVLKVLQVSIRGMDARASLDLWEQLNTGFYPDVGFDSPVLLNPSFRAIALTLVQKVESLAGTLEGEECLRVANALFGTAAWRAVDDAAHTSILRKGNPKAKQESTRSAQGDPPKGPYEPLWLIEFRRAIKAGVPGALDRWVDLVERAQFRLAPSEVEAFLSEFDGTHDRCFTELKSLLALRYIRMEATPERQTRVVELLEQLLQEPEWDAGYRELERGGFDKGFRLPADLLSRLEQRRLAVLGPNGMYPRFLEQRQRAWDGDSDAMRRLADWGDPVLHSGKCLSPLGRAVPLDARQSLLWRARAACVGNAAAAYEVATMVLEGRGCASSQRTALGWFRLAAKLGSQAAMRAMVARYKSADGEWQRAAREWSEPLAESGDPGGMFVHGVCLVGEASLGDVAGLLRALAIIERAAEAGVVDAMVFLAEKHASMPQDDVSRIQSATWFERAAEAGDVRSMLEFARNQRGGCRDAAQMARALDFVGRALEQGAIEAEAVAIELLVRLGDCAALRLQTLALHRTLAHAGNWSSMAWLADRYREGLIIPRDDSEAYYWLTLAVPRAPAELQGALAARRDEVGATLDPAARGSAQVRCREYRPGSASMPVTAR